MKILLFFPVIFSLFYMPVKSQQVTEYQICTRVREVYIPGFYDSNGNFISGRVRSDTYRVPCNATSPVAVQQPVVVQPQYVAPVSVSPRYYGEVYCNPTRSTLGALLGGGIAASMSRGNGYYWSVPVGAAIGGALFGCNRY